MPGQTIFNSARGSAASGASDLLSTLTAAEISVTGATTATISRMHVCSGTSADYTLTLPAASGNTGKLLGVRMDPALTKLVTLDGNASEKIDNSLTRIMWASEVAILLCDGSNWFKVAGKTIPMIAALHKQANQTGIAVSTYTKINVDTIDIDQGGMADTANKRVNAKRPGTYNLFATVQWDGAIPTAAGTYYTFIYKNGAILAPQYPGFSRINASDYPCVSAVSSVVLAVSDYIELYVIQGAGASMSVIGSVSDIGVTEVPSW